MNQKILKKKFLKELGVKMACHLRILLLWSFGILASEVFAFHLKYNVSKILSYVSLYLCLYLAEKISSLSSSSSRLFMPVSLKKISDRLYKSYIGEIVCTEVNQWFVVPSFGLMEGKPIGPVGSVEEAYSLLVDMAIVSAQKAEGRMGDGGSG